MNCRCGAWRGELLVIVAKGLPIVVLHDARVPNTQIRRVHPYASMRLLHDDGQDKAVVDATRVCGNLDTIVDSLL